MADSPGRRGSLVEQLDGQGGDVVIRSISLDMIEPDPDQPRVYFDEVELAVLAESLVREGLLQEPAVYPVATDGVRPTKYRLLFGERRWRAAKLAGWTEIRCKLVANIKDQDLVARLKRLDQQEKENSARAALSAVEEAKSLRVKLDVLQKLHPELGRTALVEKLAADRKMNPTAVFRLLDLYDSPESLRTAILERRITSREVAFQLSTHWGGVLRRHEADAQSKRELRFRDAVRAWAQSQGKDMASETMAAYAAAHFLDPKMVRSTIKSAEKISGQAEEEFAKLVSRAVRESWTVKDARRALGGSRSGRKQDEDEKRLYSQTERKLTVHLDRLADAEISTQEARGELARLLRELAAKVEAMPESPEAASAA
jgi:ParB/RepB/Spo0J family partition protein